MADPRNKLPFERLAFLLVEDNTHMRSLIKGILIALGAHSIKECSDGADALKLLRDFTPDIIICDWMMEPLDGIQFTRLVRQASDSHNPYVPIILLTGHTEVARIREARDTGVNEILAKPVSVQGLMLRIQAIIERPRPYIRCSTYFGPDRRRKDQDYKGERRVSNPIPQAPVNAGEDS